MERKTAIRGGRRIPAAFAVLTALALAACGAAAPAATPQSIQALVDTHARCPTYYMESPSWARDGLTIFYIGGPTLTDIRRVRVDGTDDHVLGEGGILNLAQSPDGAFVLFARQGAVSSMLDFVVANLAEKRTRVFIHDASSGGWSPDSKRIAFAAGQAHGGPIVAMDVQNGHTTPLTATAPDTPARDTRPVYSPDGRWLAFESTRDGPGSVYIMPAAGGDAVPIVRPGDDRCPSPRVETDLIQAWNPDSSSLAVLRSCQDKNLGLALYTPQGQPAGAWPDIQAADRSMVWSPGPGAAGDGSQFVFVTGSGKDEQISVAKADGTGARVVAAGHGASWSPDGKQIVYVGRDTLGLAEVYSLALDGGSPIQVTHSPSAGLCLK